MNYLEIEIQAPKEKFDEISALLYVSGISTILEEENALRFYLPEEEWGMIENLDKDLIAKKLITEGNFKVKKFEDKNWNDEWEKSIKPVVVDDRFVIHTSWNKDDIADIKGKILIEIDPKMAFGTGHNETTQLVIEMMSRYVTGMEKTLLDYGCGTAILAIGGIKLGLSKAVAIDIDPEAIENANEYVLKNEVSDKIELRIADISDVEEITFDIICANIIRSVIEKNLTGIKQRLASGGMLLISGVLIEEEKLIVNSLIDAGFQIKKIIHKAEWIGIYATH
jgi:ribosomal protein L11 methyltransferase